MGDTVSSERQKYGDSAMNCVLLIDNEGYAYGVKHEGNRIVVATEVWSTSLLDWVRMTQPVIKTDTLTVTGTMDLANYGGAAVGAGNALHIRQGTGANLAIETGGNLASLVTKLSGGLPAALGAGGGLKVDGSGTALPVTATVADGHGIKIYDANAGTYKGLLFFAGSPQVCAQDYLLALAEGDITGHQVVLKLGSNPDIDNADEDIWEVGGLYVFPTTQMQMEVISSSADDTLAGTGVQKVILYYLDNTFTEKTKELDMNGTTAVPTVVDDIYRVQYFEALQCGTGLVAAGNIDVRHLSDSPIYGRIAAGYTRSRQAIYTVPKTKTLYIRQINLSAIAAGTNGCRFTLRAKYSHKAAAARTFFLPHGEIGVQNGSFDWDFKIAESFPAGIDIKISGIGTGASANIVASAGIRGWLE